MLRPIALPFLIVPLFWSSSARPCSPPQAQVLYPPDGIDTAPRNTRIIGLDPFRAAAPIVVYTDTNEAIGGRLDMIGGAFFHQVWAFTPDRPFQAGREVRVNLQNGAATTFTATIAEDHEAPVLGPPRSLHVDRYTVRSVDVPTGGLCNPPRAGEVRDAINIDQDQGFDAWAGSSTLIYIYRFRGANGGTRTEVRAGFGLGGSCELAGSSGIPDDPCVSIEVQDPAGNRPPKRAGKSANKPSASHNKVVFPSNRNPTPAPTTTVSVKQKTWAAAVTTAAKTAAKSGSSW